MLSAHPYRSPAPPARRRSCVGDDGAQHSRRLRPLVLVFVVLGAWTGLIAWREHRLDAAIAAMPLATQQTAFRRHRDELATTCVTQPRLAAHCEAQARFLLHFPQCDDDCQQLARRFLPVPRR